MGDFHTYIHIYNYIYGKPPFPSAESLLRCGSIPLITLQECQELRAELRERRREARRSPVDILKQIGGGFSLNQMPFSCIKRVENLGKMTSCMTIVDSGKKRKKTVAVFNVTDSLQ